MKNEIALLNNNDKRAYTDLEWVQEFYDFLQGDIPDCMTLGYGGNPKLSPKKAFSIIWYLQAHFPLLPDHIEQCCDCKSLYDAWSEGYYSEKKMKHWCGGCTPPFIDEEEG